MVFPKKTLVIGRESFLGRGFYQEYCKFYPETIGTHYQSLEASRCIDLLTPDLSSLGLRKGDYDFALIAAANANLALCEREKGMAYRRNVEGIFTLIKQLIEMEIQPILFSTAYVFDGLEGSYDENSKTNPINEYGKQKEILEKKIGKLCGDNYLIIRCSKVFDLVKGSNSLIAQICSSLLKKETVWAAHDQVFSPIWLPDLVQAVIQLQIKGCKGLYNLCGKEIWTRLDLVQEICRVLRVDPKLVRPISLDEVKSPFRMPKRTDMNSQKFRNAVNFCETPLSLCIKKVREIYV